MTLWCRCLQIIEAALFPSTCAHCGVFLHMDEGRDVEQWPDTETHLEGLLCDSCLALVRLIEPPVCSGCGIPFVSSATGDHLCGVCIEGPRAFRKARSAGVHETAFMSVIHRFKYNGRLRHGRGLGRLLFDRLAASWSRQELDLVMPVPLHPARRRQRGFNQSHVLIRDWPALAHSRCQDWSDLPVVTDGLVRHRKTPRQTGRQRGMRQKNVRGAFSTTDRANLSDKQVLLVDDVFTTGSTVEACARVLLKAGARSVDVLTVARVL